MRQPNIIAVLNRALATVYRSLPMFVELVDPWTQPGDERGETPRSSLRIPVLVFGTLFAMGVGAPAYTGAPTRL